MNKPIAEYEVKVHSTKDKKSLKGGIKEYEYGTINIRDPKLREYIGQKVKVNVISSIKKTNNYKPQTTNILPTK